MCKRSCSTVWAALLAGGSACLLTTSAPAAMLAHYTLDTLSGGLQNSGTDGATSNLALWSGSGMVEATQVSGIIGTALRFGGSTTYVTPTSNGNAGDDLAGYPFTFSVWVANLANDAAGDAAISVTQLASANQYYSLGVNASEAAEIVRRSTSGNATGTPEGSSLVGATWRNIVGVFGPNNTSVTMYVDGKTSGEKTAVTDVGFSGANVNTLTVGGILRTSGGQQTLSRMFGDLDDAGLFNSSLNAADVALINGLGKTGGIGLDQLDEAQLLNSAALGTTAVIGGATWERVNALAGVVGDWSGTVAGGDAFIVTGAGGAGIAVVPEPSSLGALAAAGLLLGRRRRLGA